MAPVYKYPISFEKASTDDSSRKYRTVINFYEYQRFVGRNENLTQKSTIILPLPLGFSDSNSLETGKQDNPLVTTIANQLGGIGTGEGATANALETLGKLIEGEISSERVKTYLQSRASSFNAENTAINAARIGASFFQQLRPITGSIINPHSVLSFDGVSLKNYQLNWKLSPYNSDDVARLKTIEKEIKKKIYPELSLSDILLEYPHMCTVRFSGVDINPIRRSFITGFNLNFGSNDVMNLYKLPESSFPIVTSVSMQISELEIRTSENVNETDNLIYSNPVAFDRPDESSEPTETVNAD